MNPLPKGFRAAQPYLKNLWLGYPFMYEYNEARGHTYAIKDILDIDRINRYAPDGKGNMPTTCWKTARHRPLHSGQAQKATRYGAGTSTNTAQKWT